MPNPNISTQDWYYHAPSKNATRNRPLEPPPPSQIPGLSNVIETPDEMEERRFRRKWIRDTDSKYIQLAKGGGRKNLLSYKDPPQEPDSAVHGYPRVDWFDHYYPEQGIPEPPPPEEMHRSKKMQPRTQAHRVLPEWYVHDLHDEKESQDENFGAANNKSKKNFISFDNMSAWEREAKDEEVTRNENRVRLPQLHSNKQSKNKPAYDVQSFPKRMVRHSNMPSEGPVDFRHLMSMGYQKDWFQDQNHKHDEERKKKQMERMKQDEKRATQIRDTIEMRRPKNNATENEDRAMFKLSRFQNIQPRVESFRT